MRNKFWVRLAVATMACLISNLASAGSFTVTLEPAGQMEANSKLAKTSVVHGVETFDHASSGTLVTHFDKSGITGTYSGVEILNADKYGGAFKKGKYVRATSTKSKGYTLVLTADSAPGVNYFGFWLSALDSGNQLEFYNGDTKVGSYKPQDLIKKLGNCGGKKHNEYCGNPVTHEQPNEQYAFVNFYYKGGSFNKVKFYQTKVGGYESDNHTVAYCKDIDACMSGKVVTKEEAPTIQASTTPPAVTHNFADFCNLSTITLSGTAKRPIRNPVNFGGQCVLRLTDGINQAGGGFLSKPVSLAKNASFSTAFNFQITNSVGSSDGDGKGADGLVFVVQTKDNLLGGKGGGIGYSGHKSIGVEFDTWNNGRSDGNNGNHIGIDINGDVNSIARKNISTRMNNGAIWYAWVDYNGVTKYMEVRLSQKATRPAAATLSHKVDLPAALGTTVAFVGFTSGTGDAGGTHDIRNWQFKNRFALVVAAPMNSQKVQASTTPERKRIRKGTGQGQAASGKNSQSLPLSAGQSLRRGQRYYSATGDDSFSDYYLIFQKDGNLVVHASDSRFIWGLNQVTKRYGQITRVEISNGNLVAYGANGGIIWSALTKSPDPRARLELTANGALQLVSQGRGVMWSSKGKRTSATAVHEGKRVVKGAGRGWVSSAADLDESLIYRLANAGFDRLGQKMCLDVFNVGPHNNELDSRECANRTGQYWRFSGMMTELRHLPTYRMSTVSRGEDMCLTIDGTLVDHVLHLAPCSDSQRNNQIWIVMPSKDDNGWEITPYLEEISDKLRGFQLVVSAPPEGDGRPYVDAKTYIGKGYIWRMSPVHKSGRGGASSGNSSTRVGTKAMQINSPTVSNTKSLPACLEKEANLEKTTVSYTPWRLAESTGIVTFNSNPGVATKSELDFLRGNGSAYISKILAPYFKGAKIPAEGSSRWKPVKVTNKHGKAYFYDKKNAGISPKQCESVKYAQYTYFQTVVNVPPRTKVTQFSVGFDNQDMDDASRITIFNQKYQTGTVAPSSYVPLGGSETFNLASLLSPGSNRIVVTNLDNCLNIIVPKINVTLNNSKPEKAPVPCEDEVLNSTHKLSVKVHENCVASSKFVEYTQTNASEMSWPAKYDKPSYVTLNAHTGVALYSGKNRTGQRLNLTKSTNLCKARYPDGSKVNDRVESLFIFPVD